MEIVRLGVDYGPEWDRAQDALTHSLKTVNARLAETMRITTQEAIEKVKEEALRIPARKEKHRGTRARIAAGIQSKRTRRGRRIVTEMPSGEEMLPRGFESQWRHPTFGHTPIVTQAPHARWFIEPIAHFHTPLQRDLMEDLREMAEDIKRMTEGR